MSLYKSISGERLKREIQIRKNKDCVRETFFKEMSKNYKALYYECLENNLLKLDNNERKRRYYA